MTPAQLTTAAERLTLTIAIFHNPGASRLVLIRLEDDDADCAVAAAASSGYAYAGCIAVIRGEPKVTIEAGYEAVIAEAGYIVAGFIGVQLKKLQLEVQE